MEVVNKSTFKDFFAFRKMISLPLIRILYVIGVIFIVAVGVIVFVGSIISGIWGYDYGWGSSGSSFLYFFGKFFGGVIVGGLIIIIGNLFWRVICEWWVVFFSMHEQIVKIEENTRSKGASGNINLNISGKPEKEEG